ncbi:MAG: hypothetical protein L3K03_09050 [Thermoplasmata archaeon]|nr:hypothetical protein [Thermoplasmata archaeon]
MVVEDREVLPGGADPRLDDRVLELLAGHRGEYAFSGLRRSLGAHPESLTRALRRLQRRGEIERRPSGYRIRPEGLRDLIPEGIGSRTSPPVRTVAEVRLFPPPEEPEVLGRLAGHWFGTLRWVGIYERPEGSQLVWSRADGPGHILLTYRRGQLGVHVEGELEGHEIPELHAAAQELVRHALERLRPGAPFSPTPPGTAAN